MTDGKDQWTVYAPAKDNARHFDNKKEAEAKRDELSGLLDIEMYPPGELPEGHTAEDTNKNDDTDDTPDTDGVPCAECGQSVNPQAAEFGPQNNPHHVECYAGDTVEADIVTPDETPTETTDTVPDRDAAQAELTDRNVSDDPIAWLEQNGSHFVDYVGQHNTPAINRKGFEVLSHFYDIDVTAELQVAPEDTDHEYARVKATATTPEGRTCEAFGSAHVDRGDDSTLLLEMAGTRARKRALSIATGVGAVAVAELKSDAPNA